MSRVTALKESWFGAFIPTWLVPSARLRVILIYWWQHKRLPRLERPTRFTELIQCRKLGVHDPRFIGLCDKVAVKTFAAHMLGDEWIIPTLWFGTDVPPLPPGPFPLVVKARHGCGQNAFIRSQADWVAVRSRTLCWLRRSYGRWLDEWAYADVPRGILIEPMIGNGINVPIDYKFIVIGGRVQCIEVHLDRGIDHRWTVVDRAWKILSARPNDRPSPPTCLGAMIAGAERLGAAYDCVRVDLYEVDNQPLFGEITVFPGSGVLPINPRSLDVDLGTAWLNVRDKSDDEYQP